MKNSIKERIRSSITKKISELEEGIKEIENDSQPISPDSSIGRISRVDAIQNQQIREQMLEESQQKLVKLKNSLLKVDDENFGKCDICGNSIDEKRLQFMPESTICMSCANK